MEMGFDLVALRDTANHSLPRESLDSGCEIGWQEQLAASQIIQLSQGPGIWKGPVRL